MEAVSEEAVEVAECDLTDVDGRLLLLWLRQELAALLIQKRLIFIEGAPFAVNLS